MPTDPPQIALDTIAHVIQVALTPVFLLSGIGTLLGLFNLRNARVSDHIEHTNELLLADPEGEDAALLRIHLHRLGRRTVALDTAMVLGAVGGAVTCVAAFTLFVGALRDAAASWVLFVLFGLALACTVGSLMAFMVDTLFAWHGLWRDGPLPHIKRS